MWSFCSCFPPVKAIIEHEIKNGIPPHRIMLGGFSQVGVNVLALRFIPWYLWFLKYFTHPLQTSLLLRVGRCPCTLPWPTSISWLVSWPSAAGSRFTGPFHWYSHSRSSVFFLPSQSKHNLCCNDCCVASVLQASSGHKNLPILQCHGEMDIMIPLHFGDMTVEKLKTIVNSQLISFKTYPGLSHSSCPQVPDQHGLCGLLHVKGVFLFACLSV